MGRVAGEQDMLNTQYVAVCVQAQAGSCRCRFSSAPALTTANTYALSYTDST
jgi:hypothetical protein